MKGYRFVTDSLKSYYGQTQWIIGKWRKCKGELSLCHNGFHASQKPIDSLSYVTGTRWFECEARGQILKDTDKFCASEMRIVKEIPNKVIQRFAIDCAWRVLHKFEEKYPDDKRPRQAIEAARAYLKSPTEENLAAEAAWAAARAAAWDAAEAAWDAAEAAWAAAGGAAWDAAEGAWDAAEAAWAAAGGAAGGAAWAAARAAARAAAWDAAGGAGWAAGWDAELKWQNRHLQNLIRKETSPERRRR